MEVWVKKKTLKHINAMRTNANFMQNLDVWVNTGYPLQASDLNFSYITYTYIF